jgi:hypothetical protein
LWAQTSLTEIVVGKAKPLNVGFLL